MVVQSHNSKTTNPQPMYEKLYDEKKMNKTIEKLKEDTEKSEHEITNLIKHLEKAVEKFKKENT